MADENEVLGSWEELDDNEVMDKKLKNFKISVNKDDSNISVSLKEEGTRTQYASQVKILKRQLVTNGSPNVNELKNLGAPKKSLQQREAEYMEARMRILGEDYSGADNTNNSATVICETRPVKLVKQVVELKLQSGKVQLLRESKSPNGSHSFSQAR